MGDVPDANGLGSGLGGVPDEVDKHLPEEALVGMDDDVCRDVDVPAEVGVDGSERAGKCVQRDVFHHRVL